MDESIDQRIGSNVRRHRGEMSQAALAQSMVERGFKWSQATVWSVETGERPLRHSEALELTELLGIVSWRLSADDAETTLALLMRRASQLWTELKERSAEFCDVQVDIVMTLESIRERDLKVPAPMAEGGGWLESGPVEAVREAVYEWQHADQVRQDAIDAAHAAAGDGTEPRS